MPSRSDHIAQAEDNERFAEVIRGAQPGFLQWGVTGLFYSAVHYGRAFVVHKGGSTVFSHKAFDSAFVQAGGEQQYANYRYLKDESERARYNCAQFTETEFDRIKTTRLQPFRTWVRQQLGI